MGGLARRRRRSPVAWYEGTSARCPGVRHGRHHRRRCGPSRLLPATRSSTRPSSSRSCSARRWPRRSKSTFRWLPAARRCRCRMPWTSRRSCCWAPTRRCSSPEPARGRSARSRRESAARRSGRLQHGVPGADREDGRMGVRAARRTAALHALHAAHDSEATGRRRNRVLLLQHDSRRHGDRPVGERLHLLHPGLERLEPELSVERPQLFLRRRRGRRCGRRRRTWRLLDGAADHRSGLPDLPDVQGLHGAHSRSTAARAAGLRSASRDHRSAGARNRRERPDGAEPHPAGPGVRGRPGPGARHARDTKSRA